MKLRRGRGVDFKHRLSPSRWAEDLLLKAINTADKRALAVRIGWSRFSESNVIPEYDSSIKIPDLVVLDRASLTPNQRRLLRRTDLTAVDLLDFRPRRRFGFVIAKAAIAVEVEFSPYRAADMKQRHWKVRPPGYFGTRRVPKSVLPPTAPNVWIKEQDLKPLLKWQRRFGIPIVVCHVFDQEAFGIPLRFVGAVVRKLRNANARDAVTLQACTGVFRKLQNYNRNDAEGAGEQKWAYVIAPCTSCCIGNVSGVTVEAVLDMSPTGKYLASVVFKGGVLKLAREGRSLLIPFD